MTEPWFEVVEADQPLTQGDLLLDCPVLVWQTETPARMQTPPRPLQDRAALFSEDVVVMTQACDLAHDKVRNVVLCPHRPPPAFRKDWELWMAERQQAPTEKSWRRLCDDSAAGYVWNLTFLDRFEHPELRTEVCVANFYQVFTAPRDFLETLLRERDQRRLLLRVPYREHLAQAFARFFMRVGLPQPVTQTW